MSAFLKTRTFRNREQLTVQTSKEGKENRVTQVIDPGIESIACVGDSTFLLGDWSPLRVFSPRGGAS